MSKKTAVIYKPETKEWDVAEISEEVVEPYPHCCICNDIMFPMLFFTGSGCQFMGWTCSCKEMQALKDKIELDLLDFE